MVAFDRYRKGFVAAIFASGLLAVSPLSAEEDPDVYEPAIPPGHEELLLAMLGKGATLPDGCKLTDGHVEYTLVEATYSCPWGDVVLELAHPGQAIRSDTVTDRFAFSVVEGGPANSLTYEVAELIRSREEAFRWTWPADDDEAPEGVGPAEGGEQPADARW